MRLSEHQPEQAGRLRSFEDTYASARSRRVRGILFAAQDGDCTLHLAFRLTKSEMDIHQTRKTPPSNNTRKCRVRAPSRAANLAEPQTSCPANCALFPNSRTILISLRRRAGPAPYTCGAASERVHSSRRRPYRLETGSSVRVGEGRLCALVAAVLTAPAKAVW